MQQLSRHRHHALALDGFLLLRSQEVVNAAGIATEEVGASATAEMNDQHLDRPWQMWKRDALAAR